MHAFFKNFDKYLFLYRNSKINKKAIILHLIFTKYAKNVENFSQAKRDSFIYYDVLDSTVAKKVFSRKKRMYI